MHDLLLLALHQADSGALPIATCRVRRAGGEFRVEKPLRDGRLFDLKHARYVYSAEAQTYHMNIRNQAYGVLDFRTASFDWMVACPLPPRAILSLLFLDPLSLLLPNHGILLCHAAVMAVPQGGVLIAGPSGSGKTTLSLLACSAAPMEFRPFCDDTALLDVGPDAITCHPVNTGFGLTSTWLDRCGLAQEDCEILQKSRDKLYLLHLPHQVTHPEPLVGIAVLERVPNGGDGTEVDILSPGDALRTLLATQTHIATPHASSRLALFRSLASRVPVCRFRYRDYCDPARFRESLIRMTERD